MSAVFLTALLPPPSISELLLFLQQRTGPTSQPPHTCPACRYPRHFPPSSGQRELSSFNESLQLPILLSLSTYYPVLKPSKCQKATVRTGHGTTGWFQIRKGICQGCILSPCLLTYMQSTSCEILGWMKHRLESRLLGEISITSDIQMTPPLWQKVKNYKASWWKWKRRVKKLA